MTEANGQQWMIKRPGAARTRHWARRKVWGAQLKPWARHREDNRERPVAHKWISVSRKRLILTYCCRNVSVGRVIGIHIGRVMGGREHSVVVDSESWTKTMERNSDSTPKWTHDRRHKRNSERRTTGGTWCAGMRQNDAECSVAALKQVQLFSS